MVYNFLYIMYFTRKENSRDTSLQERRQDKYSMWLIGLSELVSYAVSKPAQWGVEKGKDVHHPSRERKGRERGRKAEA